MWTRGAARRFWTSFSTTDVGRLVPNPAEEDSQSKASEWGLREPQRRGEERRLEAEEVGR